MAATTRHPMMPPRERQGYEVEYGALRQRGAYDVYRGPQLTKSVEVESWWKKPAQEASFGLITFGAGLIWATKIGVLHLSSFQHPMLAPAPLKVAAIGVLIWLHAKWRRSVRLK